MRDSFIFYRSFFEASKTLTSEQAADLYYAICSYALDRKELELDNVQKALFSLIKPQLDANHKRWENGCKKKQSKSKTEAKQKQKLSKDEANVNVNVNVNDNLNNNVNQNEKKRGSFSAPSLLDVKEVFIEKLGDNKKTLLEAELFYNFYGSKNWFVGKQKMKNYKMAVAGWITRKKLEKNETPNQQERIEQLQSSTNRKFGVSI